MACCLLLLAPPPAPRARVLASGVSFSATRALTSEPLPTQARIGEWFERPEAVEALCSMADEFRWLSPEEFEISTKTPFPGVVARSVTVMGLRREREEAKAKDGEAPFLQLTSLSSRTECESGPQWVRDLFVRILDTTKTSSNNRVSLHRADGLAYVKSDVTLSVEIELPGFLPLPKRRMEREGSKSLQNVLEEQMSPLLGKFREEYLAWEAQGQDLS
ncbi:MAG: hypothetical protein SGPRY_005691 [Prymnesium sp.]